VGHYIQREGICDSSQRKKKNIETKRAMRTGIEWWIERQIKGKK
jgi:hypothetical protein